MMMILVVGPPLEEKYGSRPLFWAIFLTALVSGMVHWLFFPGTALLGASGIVFMMIVMSSLSGMKNGVLEGILEFANGHPPRGICRMMGMK